MTIVTRVLRVPGVPFVLDAVQSTNTYRRLGSGSCVAYGFFMSLLAHANYLKVLKMTCGTDSTLLTDLIRGH